jgi:hypothetical protein
MVCVTLRAVEMSDNNTSAVAASPNALEEIFTSRAFRRIPLVAPRMLHTRKEPDAEKPRPKQFVFAPPGISGI